MSPEDLCELAQFSSSVFFSQPASIASRAAVFPTVDLGLLLSLLQVAVITCGTCSQLMSQTP